LSQPYDIFAIFLLDRVLDRVRVPMLTEHLPALIGCLARLSGHLLDARGLKLTLLDDVDVITHLILVINNRVNNKKLLVKKVSHFVNLILCPIIENGQIFEEVDFLVFFSVLNFHQLLLVFLSIQHCKVAVFECN
jgi:hypothetical protein